MIRASSVLLLLVCLAGCVQDPVSQSQSNNPAIAVDLLFDHDGVKVYRFYDNGRYHYYAVPYRTGGAASSFSTWTESCGKNCSKTIADETPTTARR